MSRYDDPNAVLAARITEALIFGGIAVGLLGVGFALGAYMF